MAMPPLDHGSSAYLYTWDEDGTVTKVEKMSGPYERGHSSGRQTIQWPFQSRTSTRGRASTATSFGSTPISSWFRRATGQHPGLRRRSASAGTEQDLIPDYVVNFIRGDTPEIVAKRKERRRTQLGGRGVEVAGHGRFQSTQAQLSFLHPNSRSSPLRSGLHTSEDRVSHSSSGSSRRNWRRFLEGWRSGVLLNTVLSFIILLASLVLLVMTVARGQTVSKESIIFSGSCPNASHISWGLHAAINIFVIATVAGANYIFQLLSSPTRREVEAAHGQKRWLDIGIPSVRNWRWIAKSRVVLAAMVLLTAVLTQVMYNTIIFTAQEGATCSVRLSNPLFGTVIFLNLVSFLLAAVVLKQDRLKPLATLGDAISSFLDQPDGTTKGCCLMTKKDVRQGRWGLKEAESCIPKTHLWFATPTVTRWALTSFVWLALSALAAVAFSLSLQAGLALDPSIFGTAPTRDVFFLSSNIPIAAGAIIASLPQLLLVALYFTVNSHLTTYYLSHELSQYATGIPRPLRVSSAPRGYQTTSIFLTLPRPLSWLLALLFAAMGFLLSQSIFVVDERLPDLSSLVGIGLSPVGLAAMLGLLAAVALLVLGLGCRRAPPTDFLDGRVKGNPLVLAGGSCSAVFSARCHRVPGEVDAARDRVAWGVVPGAEGTEIGHCTFSARGVGEMDVKKSYAGHDLRGRDSGCTGFSECV